MRDTNIQQLSAREPSAWEDGPEGAQGQTPAAGPKFDAKANKPIIFSTSGWHTGVKTGPRECFPSFQPCVILCCFPCLHQKDHNLVASLQQAPSFVALAASQRDRLPTGCIRTRAGLRHELCPFPQWRMVAVAVSVDSSPQQLLDTHHFVNLVGFTVMAFYEPHQVAVQIFLQQLLPEEWGGDVKRPWAPSKHKLQINFGSCLSSWKEPENKRVPGIRQRSLKTLARNFDNKMSWKLEETHRFQSRQRIYLLFYKYNTSFSKGNQPTDVRFCLRSFSTCLLPLKQRAHVTCCTGMVILLWLKRALVIAWPPLLWVWWSWL